MTPVSEHEAGVFLCPAALVHIPPGLLPAVVRLPLPLLPEPLPGGFYVAIMLLQPLGRVPADDPRQKGVGHPAPHAHGRPGRDLQLSLRRRLGVVEQGVQQVPLLLLTQQRQTLPAVKIQYKPLFHPAYHLIGSRSPPISCIQPCNSPENLAKFCRYSYSHSKSKSNSDCYSNSYSAPGRGWGLSAHKITQKFCFVHF